MKCLLTNDIQVFFTLFFVSFFKLFQNKNTLQVLTVIVITKA